jgi:hypothetical protein
MPITRRPHRRDRRVPARNTRGGQITDVNHFYVTDYDLADFITLQMVIPDLTVEPLANINEKPIKTGNLDVANFSYYESGVAIGILSVTLSAVGEMVVRISQNRVADGILAIKPFNPGLRGLTGSVNGGGIIQITVPPGP